MTKQEFNRLYVGENITVYCKTEELANEFLDLADDFGYKWCTGKSYLAENCWKKYKHNTVYDLMIGEFCYIEYLKEYKRKKWNIVEFKSLKIKNTKKSRGFKKKKAFVKL